MKIRNIFGNRYKGTLGKDMVAVSWKGHDYIREYATPTNPKSELQQQHRAIFLKAIEAWKGLSPRQREFYNKVADGMSGYNLFVGRYIEAVRNGHEPETPITMKWTTENGMPLEQCWLIVRKRSQEIFVDNLDDGVAEVALTPSDVPYTFTLRRGTKEDTVLTIEDLLDAGVPVTLESNELGIKLVGSVHVPPGEQSGGAA